jgi:hypothetical protein
VAEPVDPAADWRCTRGNLRDISYAAYDPAADDHDDAEECIGVRGPVTTGFDGGRAVPACEWTISGTAATPVTRSLITDGDDTWVITGVAPDPAASAVHRLTCVKG